MSSDNEKHGAEVQRAEKTYLCETCYSAVVNKNEAPALSIVNLFQEKLLAAMSESPASQGYLQIQIEDVLVSSVSFTPQKVEKYYNAYHLRK